MDDNKELGIRAIAFLSLAAGLLAGAFVLITYGKTPSYMNGYGGVPIVWREQVNLLGVTLAISCALTGALWWFLLTKFAQALEMLRELRGKPQA
jgi:hypothetical protein